LYIYQTILGYCGLLLYSVMAEYLASIFGTEKDKYVDEFCFAVYAHNLMHNVVYQTNGPQG